MTRHRWAVPVIALATLVAMTPNSLLIPAFPTLAPAFGVSFSEVALLITAYTVAYALATPFLGIASDRHGRRPVLAGGLLLYGAGGLVPLLTHDFTLVLAGRAVMGVGGAAVLTATFALVADLFEEGRPRDRATSAVSASIAVSESLVPVAGGLLAALSWRAPFLAFALAFPVALLALLLLPRVRPGRAQTLAEYTRSARASLRSRRLGSVLLVTFAFSAVYFGAVLFLPLLAPAHLPAAFPGGAPGLAGLYLLVLGGAWGLTALALGRRARAAPPARLVLTGLATQAVVVPLILVASPNLGVDLALLALWGVASGLTFTPLLGLALQGVPEGHRGATSGLFNMATLLGLGAGPAAFGLLAEGGAVGVAAGLAAGALLATAAGFARLAPSAPAAPRPRLAPRRLRLLRR